LNKQSFQKGKSSITCCHSPIPADAVKHSFSHFGFSVENWHTLADSLANHTKTNEVAKVESTLFGTRYVIEGLLQTPVGRTPMVRSVRFIDSGETIPRFVTAYPLEEDESNDSGT
jgi:hypothetical protein